MKSSKPSLERALLLKNRMQTPREQLNVKKKLLVDKTLKESINLFTKKKQPSNNLKVREDINEQTRNGVGLSKCVKPNSYNTFNNSTSNSTVRNIFKNTNKNYLVTIDSYKSFRGTVNNTPKKVMKGKPVPMNKLTKENGIRPATVRKIKPKPLNKIIAKLTPRTSKVEKKGTPIVEDITIE